MLFRQKPRIESGENLGGRLAVSPEGYLFVTMGDRHARTERVRAQDLSTYHGKTLRIRTDGSIPKDNPFVDRPDARTAEVVDEAGIGVEYTVATMVETPPFMYCQGTQ